MAARADYVDLATMQRLIKNPKSHDLQAITRSIKTFGFVEPVVINDTTGHIVSGHGRIDALQRMKASGGALPKGVENRGGQWFIPAWHIEVKEENEYAVAIALNKTVELGGWDESVLVSILADLAARDETTLLATGYDKDDVDALLAFSGNTDAGDLPEMDEMGEGADSAETWRLTIICQTKADLDMLIGALGADVSDVANAKHHSVPLERITIPGLTHET